MKRLFLAALFALWGSCAWAAQANLFSPTTGIVSGLQLTLNYNAALSALNSCNSGSTAPANDQSGVAVTGQCWLDTSVTPNRLRIFDSPSGSWLTIGYLDAVNHIWTPVVAGGAINTIASASTTDLCSTQPAYVVISGTTTITSFGSSCVIGQTKWAVFTGALTLTHNASTLILPNSGANIPVAAGDAIQAVYLGGGGWRVIDYVPFAGLAPPPTMTLIGDTAYTMLSTDNIIATNASLSTARTITLVAANAVVAGKQVEICDRANGVTSSNTLTVSRTGSDTIVAQGATVTAIVIQNAGDCLTLQSDGVSKWINPVRFMVPQASTFTSGSAATYTTPVGAKYLIVTMCGGGGGGGAATANSGSGGGTTSFGSWTTIGGGAGITGSGGGAGGSGGANGTGTVIRRVNGGAGQSSVALNSLGGTATAWPGGQGGNSMLGGGGSGLLQNAGGAAATNSCSGGAGGGANSSTTTSTGGGGGAGEGLVALIQNPATTYTYTVGTSGSGGAAGTNAGGAGAAGRIEVVAYFQ